MGFTKFTRALKMLQIPAYGTANGKSTTEKGMDLADRLIYINPIAVVERWKIIIE